MSGEVAVMLGAIVEVWLVLVALAWWWFRAQRFTDTVFVLTDGALIPLAVIKHRRGSPPITAANIGTFQATS